MGRSSCSVKQKLRKGLWSPEEDEKLFNYITRFGVGCWSAVPKLAGLQRCGKSCRLRWINYLRPDLKRGMFSQEEEDLIISLHKALGNRWAQIATQLPGRTDNEIKNFWNSSLKKKLIKQGIDPNTHKPVPEIQVKDEEDCTDTNSLHILQPKGLQNPAFSTRMDQQEYHLNNTGELQTSPRENFWSKQAYDPTMFLSEFQQSVDPCFGFNSMPNLTNFDQRKLVEGDNSDSSASRISAYLMNEVRESSSISSNVNSHPKIQQTNSDVVENSSTFSWDVDNKLDSMFQFQCSGIQSEERKRSLYQSSEDFSDYALTSLSQELTDAFQQI